MTSVQQDKNYFPTFTYLGVRDIIRMPLYFFLVIAFPIKRKTGLYQLLLSKRGLLAFCCVTIFTFISSTALKYITFSLSVMGFS